MKKNYQSDELIDAYLRGELSSEDQKYFNNLLETDPSFKEDLEKMTKLNEVIFVHGRNKIKNQFGRLETKLTKSSKRLYMKYAGAAASLILLISVSFSLLWKTETPAKLFETYYKPFPSISGSITRDKSEEDILNMAYIYYDSKNLTKAEELLNKMGEGDTVRFYKAMIDIEQLQYQEAYELLVQNKFEGKTSFAMANQWYLALVNLILSRENNAIDLLNLIQKDTNHIYYQESNRLLDDLDN